MAVKNFKTCLIFSVLLIIGAESLGQGNVPLGIHYQAVARDNFGKELVSKDIDVRFSIVTENPLGQVVYQELHSHITTSRYGVFSLIIGAGVQTGGIYSNFSQVTWSSGLHFLKVEVKFDNTFIDMGTMQFLAVPYALYAQKSLEPGPQGPAGLTGSQGPKGDAGIQGVKGDTGPQGVKGDTGPQGLQGVQGDKGDPGLQGAKGDTGPQGQQGVQGDKGDAGIQGAKGDTGPQGQQGVQGDKGDAGIQGAKGDTGPQGQQGVQGLKGDQGDPASDDQTLSFDGINISISGGNTVNLSTLMLPHQLTILGDTLSILGGNKVVLPNQIQDLQLDQNNILKITKNTIATEIDFTRFLDDKQTLAFNSVDNTLNISGGNLVNLASLKDDADADPLNEIQTLNFAADNKLYISGVATPVDLTELKNDADASPTNEIQDLSLTDNKLMVTNNVSGTEINLAPYLDNTDNQTISYDSTTYTISLLRGGTAVIGSLVTFRGKKNYATSAATPLSNIDYVPDEMEYNDGLTFDPLTGEFIAPSTGIYTFDIKYIAPSAANGQMVMLYRNGSPYETLGSGIGGGSILFRTLTIKLISGNKIKLVINTGVTVDIGTGSFSGFRVY